jgi:hypothetical protein
MAVMMLALALTMGGVGGQVLARVRHVRDFFLMAKNYADCSSRLVKAFGELIRKIWNPRAFKGQVDTPPLPCNIYLQL